jgi:hypothetical protein
LRNALPGALLAQPETLPRPDEDVSHIVLGGHPQDARMWTTANAIFSHPRPAQIIWATAMIDPDPALRLLVVRCDPTPDEVQRSVAPRYADLRFSSPYASLGADDPLHLDFLQRCLRWRSNQWPLWTAAACAWKEHDLAPVRHLAHRITGSGATFGLPQASELGASLTRSVHDHDLRQSAAFLVQIRALLREIEG